MTTSTTSLTPWTDQFISVILPVHNGEAFLKKVISETHALLKRNYNFYEIIVVDDGSTDKTSDTLDSLLKELDGLRTIRLSRLHGLDIAASAGIDSSIGDFIIVLSPLTDSPQLIPELVKDLQSNKVLLYGVPDKNSNSWSRSLFSLIFNWYCKRYLKLDIQRGSSLVRAMDRAMANTFTQNKDKHRSLRLLTTSLRKPAKAFPYSPEKLTHEKRSFWQDIDMALDIIVSSSSHPMRLLSRLALSIAGLSLGYNLYVVAIFLFKKEIAPGWVTLSFEVSMLFFLLFVVLAILSEYLGKIMNDSRRTEAYSVVDERNSTQLIDETSKLNVYKDT